jgi:hypothetical protein
MVEENQMKRTERGAKTEKVLQKQVKQIKNKNNRDKLKLKRRVISNRLIRALQPQRATRDRESTARAEAAIALIAGSSDPAAGVCGRNQP